MRVSISTLWALHSFDEEAMSILYDFYFYELMEEKQEIFYNAVSNQLLLRKLNIKEIGTMSETNDVNETNNDTNKKSSKRTEQLLSFVSHNLAAAKSIVQAVRSYVKTFGSDKK